MENERALRTSQPEPVIMNFRMESDGAKWEEEGGVKGDSMWSGGRCA